jgi:membrane-associated phospholipid phosphatase
MTLRREKACVALAFQLVIGAGFVALQRGTDTIPPPAWLVTRVDGWLPLVPASVWIYLSWYLLPVVMLLGSKERYRLTTVAVAASFVVCAVGWVLLPVSMERAVVAGEGPSEKMLGLVYAVDPPRNLFPSFHAAIAAIVALVGAPSPTVRLGLGTWALAICIACVSTKQHFVLDVVAGVLVGVLTVRLAERAMSYVRRPRASRLALRRQIPTVSATPASRPTQMKSGTLRT